MSNTNTNTNTNTTSTEHSKKSSGEQQQQQSTSDSSSRRQTIVSRSGSISAPLIDWNDSSSYAEQQQQHGGDDGLCIFEDVIDGVIGLIGSLSRCHHHAVPPSVTGGGEKGGEEKDEDEKQKSQQQQQQQQQNFSEHPACENLQRIRTSLVQSATKPDEIDMRDVADALAEVSMTPQRIFKQLQEAQQQIQRLEQLRKESHQQQKLMQNSLDTIPYASQIPSRATSQKTLKTSSSSGGGDTNTNLNRSSSTGSTAIKSYHEQKTTIGRNLSATSSASSQQHQQQVVAPSSQSFSCSTNTWVSCGTNEPGNISPGMSGSTTTIDVVDHHRHDTLIQEEDEQQQHQHAQGSPVSMLSARRRAAAQLQQQQTSNNNSNNTSNNTNSQHNSFRSFGSEKSSNNGSSRKEEDDDETHAEAQVFVHARVAPVTGDNNNNNNSDKNDVIEDNVSTNSLSKSSDDTAAPLNSEKTTPTVAGSSSAAEDFETSAKNISDNNNKDSTSSSEAQSKLYEQMLSSQGNIKSLHQVRRKNHHDSPDTSQQQQPSDDDDTSPLLPLAKKESTSSYEQQQQQEETTPSSGDNNTNNNNEKGLLKDSQRQARETDLTGHMRRSFDAILRLREYYMEMRSAIRWYEEREVGAENLSVTGLPPSSEDGGVGGMDENTNQNEISNQTDTNAAAAAHPVFVELPKKAISVEKHVSSHSRSTGPQSAGFFERSGTKQQSQQQQHQHPHFVNETSSSAAFGKQQQQLPQSLSPDPMVQYRMRRRSTAHSVMSMMEFPTPKTIDIARVGASSDRLNQYKIVEKLGQGCEGWVVLGKDTESGDSRAIKIIPRPTANIDKPDRFQQRSDAIRNQLKVWKALRHYSMVKLYEVIDDPKSNSLFLVMDYVRQGASSVVRQPPTGSRGAYTPRHDSRLIIRWGRRLCAALEYLQRKRIFHADIKPENILIENDEPKVADFGMSTVLDLVAEDDGTMPQSFGLLSVTSHPLTDSRSARGSNQSSQNLQLIPNNRRNSSQQVGGKESLSYQNSPANASVNLPSQTSGSTSPVSASSFQGGTNNTNNTNTSGTFVRTSSQIIQRNDLEEKKRQQEKQEKQQQDSKKQQQQQQKQKPQPPKAGAIAYRAPELLRTDLDPPTESGMLSCDLWSLGLTLYVLVYGRLPWPVADPQQYVCNIVQQDIPFPPSWRPPENGDSDIALDELVPKTLIKILKEMLTRDTNNRVTVQEARKQFKDLDLSFPTFSGENVMETSAAAAASTAASSSILILILRLLLLLLFLWLLFLNFTYRIFT